MKTVQCPHCGSEVPVGRLGRKRLSIGANNVPDALHAHSTIKSVARSLGCSPGYIYKVLHDAGLKPDEVRK